ncbi:MAG: DNA polymerase III subunit delta [SAR324 cluster bacterium]|nr:DNA polymerase III subunit delta [SAR324 cluster bacterium]
MTSLMHTYLVYGNQQLQIDESSERLIDTILENRDPELCLQRFNVNELLKESGQGVEEKINHFRLSCETLPFLSDRRIIRLDHLEALKLPKGKKVNTSVLEPGASPNMRLYHFLLKYLTQPPDYCFFVLTAFGSRDQDISGPLLKTIKTQGKIQKFVAYDDDKPIAWILERAQQKQLSFSPILAQLLLDLAGNDLRNLDQELEKLSLIFANQQTVHEEDLLEHVQSNKHYSIFRITQSLSNKNLVSALETLDQVMLESSTGHVGLFVLIAQQFIKLLNIHYFQKQQLDTKAILSQLKLHPFLGRRLIAQAQSFTLPELEKIVMTMADLDLKLKFNAKDARVTFQNFFQQICTNHFCAG